MCHVMSASETERETMDNDVSDDDDDVILSDDDDDKGDVADDYVTYYVSATYTCTVVTSSN